MEVSNTQPTFNFSVLNICQVVFILCAEFAISKDKFEKKTCRKRERGRRKNAVWTTNCSSWKRTSNDCVWTTTYCGQSCLRTNCLDISR